MKPTNKIMNAVERSPQDKKADMNIAKQMMKKKKSSLAQQLTAKGLV